MKKYLLYFFCFLILTTGYAGTNELKEKTKQSLEKSAGYFRSLETKIEIRDVVMMLFSLEQHFRYPLDLQPVEKFKERDSDLGKSYFKVYDSYFEGRNVPLSKDSMIEYFKSNPYDATVLNNYSMLCKSIPLPENYLQVLNENAEKGGFEMLASVYELENILQLGCLTSTAEAEKLKEKLVKSLINLIKPNAASPVADNVKYGCLVMLYYIGKADVISETHIKSVIENQLSNGGWGISSNTSDDVLTSVLAMWVLLEYNSRNL